MKSFPILVALTLIVLLGGCQSEVNRSPAAEVSTVTPAPADPAGDQPAPGANRVEVIEESSSIRFIGAKVTRDHHGHFNEFDGWIDYTNGRPVKLSFEIDIESIETDDPKLTKHLKSADFFNVAQYPKATFVSTSISEAPAGSPEGATHTLRGVLDMHGVRKELSIPVVTNTTQQGTHATSEFSINRHDWGISYRGAADDLIRDNVLIRLDLRFPPPPA